MIKPRLFLICGLPGAGKTTLARELESQFEAIRFCPDEWMAALALDFYDEGRRAKIEGLQWELARTLLGRGVSVIIEWGTWGRSESDRLRLGARTLGAEVELRYLAVPVDMLYERLRQRGMEHPPIEREDLARWAEAFQEPTAKEMALFDSPRR